MHNKSVRKRSLLRVKSIGYEVFATPGVFNACGVGFAAPVTHQDQGSCVQVIRIQFPFRRSANQKTVSAMWCPIGASQISWL
jgi:hypothetical protein